MQSKKNELRWALFALGAVMVNFPLLNVFNMQTLVFGVPGLFVSIFLLWSLLIIALYFLSKKTKN
jgi:hypothetical protein